MAVAPGEKSVMPHARLAAAALSAAALSAAALSLLPGCITLFSKTEVVRGGEPQRPVRFENPQAADEFERAVSDKRVNLSSTRLGGPFVTLYAKDRVLSESAHFNDCAARCDTDRDGTITFVEAAVFGKTRD
jgi:hypothetical protein